MRYIFSCCQGLFFRPLSHMMQFPRKSQPFFSGRRIKRPLPIIERDAKTTISLSSPVPLRRLATTLFIAQHSVLVPSSTSSFQRRRVKNPRVALWHLLNEEEEEEEKGTAASALFSRRKTDRPVGGHLLVAKAITFLWMKKGICPLLTKKQKHVKNKPLSRSFCTKIEVFSQI